MGNILNGAIIIVALDTQNNVLEIRYLPQVN